MTCYHPNKGFVVGLNSNNKKDIKYCPYTINHLFSHDRLTWKRSYDDIALSGLSKIDDFVYSDLQPYPTYYCLDSMILPCGQCLGCRIDKSREWANRMMLEAKYHDSNFFLTLTYDDEHVPTSQYWSDVDGEVCTSLTLCKRDFQLFMKRLRRRVEVHHPVSGEVLDSSKLRFYAAGEYGSSSFRPHYHAIIFNLKLDDLKLLHRNEDGFNYFTSDLISKCWPHGYHLITQVTWETCAYVARYVTKKLNGDAADFYQVFNIEPEFSLMSRRPGIGKRYYDDEAKDSYLNKTDIIRLSTDSGPLSFRPPRYFDSLFDIENPELLAEIKQNRVKMAENIQALKLSKTNLSLLELLEVEENNFKHKTRSLLRSDV